LDVARSGIILQPWLRLFIVFKVQGFVADEPTDASHFVSVNCLACNGIHLVNPGTGLIIDFPERETACLVRVSGFL
jgi:hypothetical protein